MGEFQVIGVPDEVMADKRVQEAVDAVQKNPEREASRAVLQGLAGGLERYGVKLRPISLTVVGPMMVQLSEFKPAFPAAYQMTALLFILGAPLRDVYTALQEGQTDGTAAFMARASEWVSNSGIPQDMSAEVVEAISETFRIASKLLGGDESDDKKKGADHHGS